MSKIEKYRNPFNYNLKCYKLTPVFYKEFLSKKEIVKELGLDWKALSKAINCKRILKGYIFEKV